MRHIVILLLLGSLSFQAKAAPQENDTRQKTQSEPLGLDDLLEAALAHDGRVLAAHAGLEVYRAKYNQAWWAWFPRGKLEAVFGGPVGERRLDCPDDEETCVKLKHDWRPGSFDFGEASYAVGGKLEAAMPLYTFGKIDEAKRAARAGLQAGKADIRRARQEVALEVRRAWYGGLLAQISVEILEDGEKKIKDAEKKLTKMLDELNEDVTDRDLFKLRYYASEIRKMLIQAKQGQKLSLAALRFLTGIEGLGQDKQLAESELTAPEIKFLKRSEYLKQAAHLRPEMLMMEAALEASRAKVEIEKAFFYPDFFLAGFVKGSYSPVHDYIENPLLNNGYTNYDAGLTLGFRLGLDIPQKIARLDQAQAELARLEARVNQAKQAAGLELDKRLGDLQAALDNQKVIKKGRRAAKAWMRSNLMSYGVGISNTKDLLDSLTAYSKSRIEMAKATHDTLLAHDRLDATLGNDLSRSKKP